MHANLLPYAIVDVFEHPNIGEDSALVVDASHQHQKGMLWLLTAEWAADAAGSVVRASLGTELRSHPRPVLCRKE